ncbi:ABC-2 transporter permease [uncultured Subdoligranulum sp.]|uniref:ABC-2 transporter permease n=1 Tax=uncultured Subdoligranulum sp. TaxID=512298 RepID=UPI0025DFC170|nr:ABC-2 transporter permease [uncultured Subdoligranulum sp.]
MKGLLYKDWSLIAGGYKTNFLFLLVFYGLLTVAGRMTFLAYAMVFVVGMYASSTISMDENSHWDAYAHTLPVSPGQLVSVKYWLTLILTVASIPLSFFLIALIPAPKPTFLEAALGLTAACTVTLFYFSFVIPLSYKFGAAKARSWVSISLLVVAFGPVALFPLLPESTTAPIKNAASSLDAAITANWSEAAFTIAVVGAMLLFSLVCMVISWAISVRIYTRKTY